MENNKVDLITPTILLILGFTCPVAFWILFIMFILAVYVDGVIKK